MNPGALDRRIKILSPPTTQDTYGQQTGTWPTFAETWASINPLQGKEFAEARQVHAEVTHKVRIRYRSGILPSMRVQYGSRIFEILGPPINPGERNVELRLMCKELVV